MKPIILLQPNSYVSDQQYKQLKERANDIGLELVIAEDVKKADILFPPLPFRDQCVLSLLNGAENVIADPGLFAERLFNMADAMEAERLRRTP